MSSAVQNREADFPRVLGVRRFRLIRLGCDVHSAYFLRSGILGKGCLSQDRDLFRAVAVEKSEKHRIVENADIG